MAVTLDPSAVGPGITLSGGNLTATSSGSTGSTLATAHFPTGKYYYEFTVGTAANTQVGLMNAAGLRSEYLGFDYSHSAAVNWNGGWLSSGGVTTAPAFVGGHVYGMAIDITNHKAWLKDLTAATSWNLNGTADPVTGVNAATFATISGDIYPACSLNQSGDQVTFNFGASAYTGTVPSGYASWSGAPPTGTLATTEAQDIAAFNPALVVLLWSDEFTALDIASTSNPSGTWRPNAIWQNLNMGYRDFAGTSWNLNPNETSTAPYTAFTQSGSILTISAFRTPPAIVSAIRASLDAQGNTALPVPAWCGGLLVTNSAVRKFKYGYIEWLAQCPIPGKGMFPALWVFASDGSSDALNKGNAEIDVMEIFGLHDIWDTTLHEKDNTQAGPDLHVGTQTSDTDGWHTWGLDWQPTYLKFYYDNTLIYTVTGSDATFYSTNMDVLINFAMDAPWFPSGNLSDGTTPSPMTMNIDYVRVYNVKPGVALSGCNILKVDGTSSLLLVNGTDHLILTNCVPTGGIPSGTLATIEARDVASFIGSVATAPGTLTVIEAPDLAAFTGTVVNPPVAGYLAAAEAQDIARLIGTGPPSDIPGPLHFGRRVVINRW